VRHCERRILKDGSFQDDDCICALPRPVKGLPFQIGRESPRRRGHARGDFDPRHQLEAGVCQREDRFGPQAVDQSQNVSGVPGAFEPVERGRRVHGIQLRRKPHLTSRAQARSNEGVLRARLFGNGKRRREI
jgi:hypothetical protein